MARLFAPIIMGSLVLASACSSTQQDRGLEGSGVENNAPDTNPEGIPYPADNIGTQKRKNESTPGNRIANFKFLGYPDANKGGGLQPISLAQYYDPEGARYDIIHIQAAGVWCSACRSETEVVVPLKTELDKRRTVWLVSLAEGPTGGVPSKQRDLDGWIAEFKSPFTHWLDPGNANLGPFYDRTALPWNANIDASTMEILTAGTGTIPTKENILREIDEALDMKKTSKLKAPAAATTTP